MKYIEPRCPICGSKAYIERDTPDGFYMGWSVGCPRYCINDGIHGNVERLANHNFSSREEAVEWWKNRVKREQTHVRNKDERHNNMYF